MSEALRNDRKTIRLDNVVRARLKTWPQRPPGATASKGASWLRARPSEGEPIAQPYLKVPGSDRMRTIPDGLWLHFGGTPEDPFADILCIEACSTFQNLLDKRSRFAPSTTSLLAFCPLAWLLAPIQPGDETPRWRLIPACLAEPVAGLTVPVRDIRVLYGLREKHYRDFATQQIPHAHEFFCPMTALVDERGFDHPEMQALMGRLTANANFFPLP